MADGTAATYRRRAVVVHEGETRHSGNYYTVVYGSNV